MKFLVVNYRRTSLIVCFILALILVLSAFIINENDAKSVNADQVKLKDEIYINDTVEAAARNDKELPIYCVQNDKNQIAITFDNAWGADDIPEILRALDKYKVKATFFVLGIWVEKYPDIVKEIHSRGHEIANHSYAHYKPTKLDKAGLVTEIAKCNEAIKKVTGDDCKIYRPPYGDYNDFVIKTVREEGMYPIQWDVDSLDWKDETTEDDIIKRITAKTKSGSILLFHNDTKCTAKVLPEVIKQLMEKGFEFVKVSDLIYKDNYVIDYTGKQFKK